MINLSQDFQNAKVALGLPIGGDVVHWRFATSLLEMIKPQQHGVIVRQGSLVDASRNEIVKLFLQHPVGFTHLLFLDSDMIFPHDTIVKLIEANAPVASGLCYTRTPPMIPCVFERTQNAENAVWKKGTAPLSENQSQVIDGAGTGCLLIRRDVFEQLSFPWFAIEWHGEKQRGEDLYFAEKCFEKNIQTKIHTGVITQHINSASILKADESFSAQIKLLV